MRKVLDDGFVKYVQHMGSDNFIAENARVTSGSKSSDDRSLIRYLMRHRHTTPLEFCELVLHLRIPMDCWRQMVRHRTASINEYSTRYSEAIDSCAKTSPDQWRLQSKGNRQGSSGEFLDEDAGAVQSYAEANLHDLSRKVYENRIAIGIAKEQARKDLPLSNYTEVRWKMDLHNLLHFLSLRLDAHAQWEIRQYAEQIAETVKELWPITWEAFVDYRLEAITLTRLDVIALRTKDETVFTNDRERQEFLEKVRRIYGIQR